MKRRQVLGAALLFAVHLAGCRTADRSDTGALRIVSLSPAITETLFAVGAGDRLVGVSDYCTLPPGAPRRPRLGTSLTPSYESIAALRPTLILSDDSFASRKAELRALGRAEFLPWLTLGEIVSSTRRIGQLVNQVAPAEALATRLAARLGAAPPPGAPRVLLVLSYDPGRPGEIWFIKRNSLHGAALGAAGGRNAVDRDVPGLPRLGPEDLLALDPDAVVLLTRPGASAADAAAAEEAFRRLSPLRAVRDRKLLTMPGSESVGPSILAFTDALEETLRRLPSADPRQE